MLHFQNFALRRGEHLLFHHADLQIHPGQKVGIAGRNGTGKSSLFAAILQQLSADHGSVTYPPDWRISHVTQETLGLPQAALAYVIDGDPDYRRIQLALDQCDPNEGTRLAHLHADLDAIDGYNIGNRASKLLAGLGFSDTEQQQPVQQFSGGWRMRLNLARALLQPSDLLLLDEPTNHLDLDTVIWLEQWLQRYTGTLLLISHDRLFLDNLISHTLHIEQQNMTLYPGNYSTFEQKRAARLAGQQALFERQQRERAHIQSFVDRFRAKATKAKQVQSRIKALTRMQSISMAQVDSTLQLRFLCPEQMPSPLVDLDNISAGYADTTILRDIRLMLHAGDRIGLLGPNGAGKSTLIKLIAGEIAPSNGQLHADPNLVIGYFAQHQLEQVGQYEHAFAALQALDAAASEQTVRDYLGRYGFQGDKAYTDIGHLSGGEKARLVLALLIYQKPHLLLLDEPTNHLDIEMRHAINLALQDYAGGMIIVSHDRFLLESVTDQFYLVSDQCITRYDGDLADYQHWLRTRESDPNNNTEPSLKKQQRQEKAQLRQQQQPLKKRIKQLDKKLHQLQTEKTAFEQQLSAPELYEADQKAQLMQLLQQQTTLEDKLTATETDWLETSELLETLEQQLSAD